MSQSEIALGSTQIADQTEPGYTMEDKKKKLHEAPALEDDSFSKKKKTSEKSSKTSKTSNCDKENISENREEGEILKLKKDMTDVSAEDLAKNVSNEDETVEDKEGTKKKSKYKSASKHRSASRSRSNARSKSHLKSKSKSKQRVLEVEEETAVDEAVTSSYNLRPRKNVDYTVASPEEKMCSGTGNEDSDEKSDVSFKAEEEHLDSEVKTSAKDSGVKTSDPTTEVPEEEVEEKSPDEEAPAEDDSVLEEKELKPEEKDELEEEVKELLNENIEKDKENYENFTKEEEEKTLKSSETAETGQLSSNVKSQIQAEPQAHLDN